MIFKIGDPDLPEIIEYFVIEGASKLASSSGKTLEELWPDMLTKGKRGKMDWTLKVFLNGVLMPTRDVFEHIQSQIDEMATRRAEEMIKERFNGLDDMMEEIQSVILEKLREKFPDEKIDEEVSFNDDIRIHT